MRAEEFIIERSINLNIDTEYGNNMDIKLWINPTLSDLRQLVSRYILRGLVWSNLFLVWDGEKAIHNDVAIYVIKYDIFNDYPNVLPNRDISVVLSDVDNIEDIFDEWVGNSKVINGIYYMAQGDPTTRSSFRKSLGI